MDFIEDQPIVVLVHGIRDHALWQKEVRDVLKSKGFNVELTNYDRYDLLRFLVPIPYFRKKAISVVLNQIRIVSHANPGKKISIIAHSFGTYIVANIIKENFDLRFGRIVFCGSVLKFDFPFEQCQERFDGKILNDVGTKDIWPAIAESVTTGYGYSGTYGFKRPLVHDRWHNGAKHGFFLKPGFCKDFWVPFLKYGRILPSSSTPEKPSLVLQAIGIIKLKYFISIALISLVLPWREGFQIGNLVCAGLPGETAWIYVGELDRKSGLFHLGPYAKITSSDKSIASVEKGDMIEIIEKRKTMILDYGERGTERALDSPFQLDGKINYTCRTLEAGETFFVADYKIMGPSDRESHEWLRIRNEAPGG